MIFFVALFLNSDLIAKSLSDYRAEFSMPASQVVEPVSGLDMSLVKQAVALNVEGASVRKNHLSSFVRQNLLERAREFMMKDLYDTPQLFTPSSTISMAQVEENIQKKSNAFCSEKIKPDFEALLKRYAEQREDPVDSKMVTDTDLEGQQKVRALLTKQIENLGLPLGTLTSVEIENHALSRLIFTDSKHEVYKVGLPMLISVITGEDYYYVQMLSCFNSLVSTASEGIEKLIKDEKSTDFARRDLLESMHKESSHNLQVAELTHQALSKVSEKDLNTLIELFLTYNRGLYPSVDEWDTLKMKMIEKASTLSDNPAQTDALNSDIKFFEENLDAIYRLENFRQEAKHRQEVQKDGK